MEHIDAVLYINLAHRLDRNAHLLGEMKKWGIPASKLHRIDAISRTPGALGCGLSHIKALTEILSHSDWNTVLVIEDDFTFRTDDVETPLQTFFHTYPQFDVVLLSYNPEYIQYEPTPHPSIHKVRFSQTTSSYLIRRHYVPILLQNMKESTYIMERFGKCHENCVDIYWTKLQPLGNWYALFPALGYQYDNYSDIEQRITSYGC